MLTRAATGCTIGKLLAAEAEGRTGKVLSSKFMVSEFCVVFRLQKKIRFFEKNILGALENN